MGEATERRVLTALYEEQAAADRAIDGLIAAGFAPEDIARGPASAAEVNALKHGRSTFMAALFEFEMPTADRQSYERGLDRGGIVVVVRDVPLDRLDEALDILDAEALDLEAEAGEEGFDSPDHPGAIGTVGGSGVGMGDVDRLTGRRLGDADPPDEDARKAAARTTTGAESAVEDRHHTPQPRRGRRIPSDRHGRARAYVYDVDPGAER